MSLEGENNTVPSETDPSQSEGRIRSLTEKGKEMYESNQASFMKKINKSLGKLEGLMSKLPECANSSESLKALESGLSEEYKRFRDLAVSYRDFLSHTGTQQSLDALMLFTDEDSKYAQQVNNTLSNIHERRQQMSKTTSPKSSISSSISSQVSKSSSASKISSVIAIKRAKAEAARARLSFVEMETDLKKQQAQLVEQENLSKANVVRKKAELEADLQLLAIKKEAAAAEAEVQALESVDDIYGTSQSVFETAASLESVKPMERTRLYVEKQREYAQHTNPDQNGSFEDGHIHRSPHQYVPPWHGPELVSVPPPEKPKVTVPQIETALIPAAPAFYPHKQATVHETYPAPANDTALADGLTKFLLKKDLLLSRLNMFNDLPETYGVWKSSFQAIVAELGCTPLEEMDLLVKWLGSDSRRHAISIRNSNASHPARGLKKIWERLDERYGRPEMVEASLKNKLSKFPKLTNKDNQKLYDLADILSEIESAMEDPIYRPLLSYFNTSSGINPIVNKLPYQLQEKWTNRAVSFKKSHDTSFPPFAVFAEYVREMSQIKNDPGFHYETAPKLETRERPTNRPPGARELISARKTDLASESDLGLDKRCPLHKTGHSLNKCRAFKTKSLEERKKLLKEKNICFKCCTSDKHRARACTEKVNCSDCGSNSHPAALHVDSEVSKVTSTTGHGGEPGSQAATQPKSLSVNSKCTQVCKDQFNGKSCAKTLLVRVYRTGHPNDVQTMYAIIDDQSNRSLAKSEFFENFGITGQQIEYTLSSCAGQVTASGRRANGFTIASLDGKSHLELPTLIECNQIPNMREEVPTPDVAKNHPHLLDIVDHIPPLDDESEILLLIGRDLIEAHHVFDQRIGPRNSPYAQKLCLGWVIIGETCLGKVHKPDHINVNKTHVLGNGRESIFKPCQNELKIREQFTLQKNGIGDSVFERTSEDNKPGMSIEDIQFLKLMDTEFKKNDTGNWEAPLPFRSPRPRLPNNRALAMKRAMSLELSFKKDPVKKQHFVTFMQNIFDNGHAEVAPPLKADEECWYLPIFGVYHPQKPGQIRGVFDSSAKFDDVSLNSVLMSGPDLTNSLLGILLRFRRNAVAVTADIQQMFYCFSVQKEHRNFLRFLWYRDNNPEMDLIEYRMCVHVFGNSPSPAIASYGLRKTAANGQIEFGVDVKDFVDHDFYVDDGITSVASSEEAISLVQRAQHCLEKEGNLRLHKIASNCEDVMKAFANEDLAKNLKGLDFSLDNLPLQRSLGLCWDLKKDTFTFRVDAKEDKPYTRRGVLSVVNSLYDPLGFVAPVTIQGKLFLRKMSSSKVDWDEPLSPEHQDEWRAWKESLNHLEDVQVPRTYSTASLSEATNKEVHVFSDASEKAIAAVAYLKTTAEDGGSQLGFLIGKAKVAPTSGHTIPRLELCGAVLAVEIAEIISDQLGISPACMHFHTDSKVVLGYINNQTKRFYTYVANRIHRIRAFTTPDQWSYIVTDKNPADLATRSVAASAMHDSPWLLGPSHLLKSEEPHPEMTFPLVNPGDDKEIRPSVTTVKTDLSVETSIRSHRFERFSVWTKLLEAIAYLQHISQSFNGTVKCKGWHSCSEYKTLRPLQEAEEFIIKTIQSECFNKEISSISNGKPLDKNSPLLSLSPVVDEKGMLRIGGRLSRSSLDTKDKNPIVIPSRHHIATLLVRHYHENVKHQGRHFTEGAVRAAGFWIIDGKRLISSVIHNCFKCRKLRGRQEIQKMSDLPLDRLEPGPPFTSVGVDTFGPWSIVSRRTRGGLAQSKRWALLFTCLTSRAIHIELIEEMSTSSFINALRRFAALRGNVKELRSDRGTNFIGAADVMNVDKINVEDAPVRRVLNSKGIVWIFNPPYSSHMGGIWERMIGVTRRILDSMLMDNSGRSLTHEVLSTFMAEVCAIVNARPLISVSNDPESPEILSPSLLVTQKSDMPPPPVGVLDRKTLYRAQWKRVQSLAEEFWKRWRTEYLVTLQKRRKWQSDKPNVSTGDIVLLEDPEVSRNEWPVGRIVNAIPSENGKVRKVEVCVVKKGKRTIYTRPVTKLVRLTGCSQE